MRRRQGWLGGQSLVEFAVLLPLVTLLMLGAVDLARVFHTKIVLANASKTAAILATNTTLQWKPNANQLILDAARREAEPGIILSSATYTGNWQPNSRYTVTVSTQWSPITPMMSNLWGGGAITLTHSTEMRHNCTAVSACDYPTPTPVPTATPSPTPCTATSISVALMSPPVVSGTGGNKTAALAWTTSALAYGAEVRIGPKDGAAGTYGPWSAASPPSGTPSTAYTKSYGGLSGNGVYHYQVRMRDVCGNWYESGDYTINT